MADNLSDYAENALLDHSVNDGAMTVPGCFLALFTAAPSDSGGGTEVSGGSYARQSVPAASWAAASGGSKTTSADVNFPTASASWGTITHIGLFDAVTAGNLLWHGPLTASKAIGSGDVFRMASGQLTLTLA
jgi:hypothetical protein